MHMNDHRVNHWSTSTYARQVRRAMYRRRWALRFKVVPRKVTTRRHPEPVTLESCICGGCYHCPDGWHSGSELPCSCTADCALTDAEPEDADDWEGLSL